MQPRQNVNKFTDIPNVGKATEADFLLLGLKHPIDLIKCDPYQMYYELCDIKAQRHDPCVFDVFISAVKYMQGEPAQKWWFYTEERKKYLDQLKQ